MSYPDWKKIYIDKTMTLDEWKSGLSKAGNNGKIEINGSGIIPKRGLAAGKTISVNANGSPPKLIGRLPDLERATIQKTLEHFEKQIVQKSVEHAIIITARGDVYHCSGGLNGIKMKYFEQLRKELNGAIVTHNHPVGSDNEYTFSRDDISLFEAFNLEKLRGIDEKFVYELNRNAYDLDFKKLTFEDMIQSQISETKDAHELMGLLAKINGFGYRRWEHE